MTKSAPGGTHAQYDVIWQEFSFVGIISRKWLGLGLGLGLGYINGIYGFQLP